MPAVNDRSVLGSGYRVHGPGGLDRRPAPRTGRSLRCWPWAVHAGDHGGVRQVACDHCP